MWNRGGLWSLRVRKGQLRLWIPLPVHVLWDLLLSLDDLCGLILPRFGVPNYAAALREMLESLGAAPLNGPLVEIHTGELELVCKRFEWRES